MVLSILAYRGDGVVMETSDRQFRQQRTTGHVPMEGSRNMLLIRRKLDHIWNRVKYSESRF
jgi:hypothetical protein